MDKILYNADCVHKDDDTDKLTHVLKIEKGLKIRINKVNYEKLINNQWINNNFKLNIKRLSRWYWSVYFDNRY